MNKWYIDCCSSDGYKCCWPFCEGGSRRAHSSSMASNQSWSVCGSGGQLPTSLLCSSDALRANDVVCRHLTLDCLSCSTSGELNVLRCKYNPLAAAGNRFSG